MPKLTTEQFIEKARAIHGDKYDYSKVEYVDAKTKVCIICPEHGEFWQTPDTHGNKKRGCPVCAVIKVAASQRKWTKETIITEAKRYKTQAEFKKNSYGAYSVAQKKCMLTELHVYWEKKEKPRGYWTKEKCFEVSHMCKTRSEFQKSHSSAYNVCRKNAWLDDMIWLINQKDGKEKVDTVYIYIFEELKAVYIGRTLTIRFHKRDYEHRNTPKDSVYRFAKEFDTKIPKITSLIDNVTIAEGCIKEEEYIKTYLEKGYYIINKAKVGLNSSSVGALKFGKLTKDYCLHEAKKYNSKSEFERNNTSAYLKAKSKGWLLEYDWFVELHMPKGYWDNYDNCFKEFEKYGSLKLFRAKCPMGYKRAVQHGFTKLWRKKRVAWNKKHWTEDALKEIRKLYPRRSDLLKNESSAYKYLSENNLLDLYYPIKKVKPIGYWNIYENVKNTAEKYKSRWDFGKHEGAAYDAARRNGWLDELFPKR